MVIKLFTIPGRYPELGELTTDLNRHGSESFISVLSRGRRYPELGERIPGLNRPKSSSSEVEADRSEASSFNRSLNSWYVEPTGARIARVFPFRSIPVALLCPQDPVVRENTDLLRFAAPVLVTCGRNGGCLKTESHQTSLPPISSLRNGRTLQYASRIPPLQNTHTNSHAQTQTDRKIAVKGRSWTPFGYGGGEE